MNDEDKKMLKGFGVVILIVVIGLFISVGPKGCDRSLSSWKASAYGSDWLVVQYAQDGSIISSWELTNKSIGNEAGSDGIYFLDDDDNVVHLSGHYIYVEVQHESKMDGLKKRFLKEE